MDKMVLVDGVASGVVLHEDGSITVPQTRVARATTPWSTETDTGRKLISSPGCRGYNEICDTVGLDDDSEDLANASFIVQAVNCHADLLAALKNLSVLASPFFTDEPQMTCLFDQARIAIEKAEGK